MTHESKKQQDLPGFSLKARVKSFVYAGAGIISFFKYEHNARIHLAATIAVIMLSLLVHVSRSEAIVLTFCIALVWITEMINTAIEKTMDLISKERHPQIKAIKDMAAGSVLVAAITAVIAGAIIFIPKLLML